MSVDDRLTRDAARARGLDLDEVFAQIDATPPSRLGRLRALVTPVRRGLLVGYLGTVGVLLVAGQELRALDAVLVAWVTGLAAVGVGVMSVALRPLHRPPLARPWAPAALAAAVAVAVALGEVLPGMPVTPEPAWPIHFGCWRATTIVAVVAVIGGALLERDGATAAWRSAALAFGAGVVAFAAQTLVCPVVDPAHVGLAHASSGALVALAWAAVRAVRGWIGGQSRIP